MRAYPSFSTFLLLLAACTLGAQEEPHELNSARIGQPYAYALETSRRAYFEKIGGNATWLSVTAEGVLIGTPSRNASTKSTITVRAYS